MVFYLPIRGSLSGHTHLARGAVQGRGQDLHIQNLLRKPMLEAQVLQRKAEKDQCPISKHRFFLEILRDQTKILTQLGIHLGILLTASLS